MALSNGGLALLNGSVPDAGIRFEGIAIEVAQGDWHRERRGVGGTVLNGFRSERQYGDCNLVHRKVLSVIDGITVIAVRHSFPSECSFPSDAGRQRPNHPAARSHVRLFRGRRPYETPFEDADRTADAVW